jgi:hypothetical protein
LVYLHLFLPDHLITSPSTKTTEGSTWPGEDFKEVFVTMKGEVLEIQKMD